MYGECWFTGKCYFKHGGSQNATVIIYVFKREQVNHNALILTLLLTSIVYEYEADVPKRSNRR